MSWRIGFAGVLVALVGTASPDALPSPTGLAGVPVLAWSDIEDIPCWRTSWQATVSPDRRYLAWITNSGHKLCIMDLIAGRGDTVSGQWDEVSAVLFLPDADATLCIYSGAKGGALEYRLLDIATMDTILKVTPKPKKAPSGIDRVCDFRPLANGVCYSTQGDTLYLWSWLHAPRVAPTAPAEDLGTARSPTTLPCQRLASVDIAPGELVRQPRVEMGGSRIQLPRGGHGFVSADGTWLLLPITYPVSAGGALHAWVLVDVSDPSSPVVAGVAEDGLSYQEAEYGDGQFTTGRGAQTRRDWPYLLPVYLGGGLLVEYDPEQDALYLLDSTTETTIQVWDADFASALDLPTEIWPRLPFSARRTWLAQHTGVDESYEYYEVQEDRDWERVEYDPGTGRRTYVPRSGGPSRIVWFDGSSTSAQSSTQLRSRRGGGRMGTAGGEFAGVASQSAPDTAARTRLGRTVLRNPRANAPASSPGSNGSHSSVPRNVRTHAIRIPRIRL